MSGDPHNDPNAQGDAFKTLFVARVVSILISACFLQVFLHFWLTQLYHLMTSFLIVLSLL